MSKQAPFTVCLAYPSPYGAGMSSLGYQRIYRAIMESPGLACERAFLDDEAETDLAQQTSAITYESGRPIADLPVVAVSVAYEIEIAGLIAMLERSGIPPRRVDRDDRHPFVLAGGPLTFSNPLPLAGIVDAIVVGEAEEITIDALRVLESVRGRDAQKDALAKIAH
ncbi:MAG TPA: radical SAM protein, partial [Byssovorax sp.]